jgi:hypothetical protein
MPGTVRSRVEKYLDLPGKAITWYQESPIVTSDLVSWTGRSQTTISHGNPIGIINDRRRRQYTRNTEDIGGSFSTVSVDTRGSGQRIVISTPINPFGPRYSFDGHVYAHHEQMDFSAASVPTSSSKSQMDAYGTQAIARMSPTNPLAGMGQFLGELRDLPKIPEIHKWKSHANALRQHAKRANFDAMSRDVADEFLNQTFGWAPFVGDLKKFAEVSRDSARHMQRFCEGANRTLRRTYHFPDVSNVTVDNGVASYGNPPLPTYCVSKPGSTTYTVMKDIHRWCVAAFSYYLPPILPGDNEFVQAINKAKVTEALANRLYGARLTPDLIWKLAPWSWAADWVTTAGDCIHNWSSFTNDGLVLKYSYMMESISVNEVWQINDLRTIDGRQWNLSQSRRASSKQRTIGTPYGFGLNAASFTGKQWAIIAALGISKQPLSINKG